MTEEAIELLEAIEAITPPYKTIYGINDEENFLLTLKKWVESVESKVSR